MRRVVVTGMGMVTPLGRDLESTWSALLAGKSGVGPITLFDARTFPTRIAAEVDDFRLEDYIDDSDRWAEHSRNSKFALAAAAMAMKDSGLLDSQARAGPAPVRRLPGVGRRPAGFSQVREPGQPLNARRPRRHAPSSPGWALKELHPVREAEQEPGTPSGHLASVYGARGSMPTA